MGATQNNGTNEMMGDKEAKQPDHLSTQDHSPLACELLAHRVDQGDNGNEKMGEDNETMGRETKQ